MSIQRAIPYIVLATGIAIRFFIQFLDPSINGDEVHLGFNIKERGLPELLMPLDRYQSAPPLYLLVQKFFFGLVRPFWVSAKLFSFAVSVTVLLAASRLSTLLFTHTVPRRLFLLFFAFSPFVIYYTLTIKQYGVDLLFVMVAMLGYGRYRTSPVILPFFIIWTLFSNIGTFHIAGFLLYEAIRHLREVKGGIPGLLKAHRGLYVKAMLTPLPYIAYFAWYMGQDGAQALKAHQISFFKDNFMPLDGRIIPYLVSFFHGVSVFFISSVHAIGYPGLVLALLGLVWVTAGSSFRGRHVLRFGLCGIGVHVGMNILRVYPLTDRLYLYFAATVLALLLVVLDAGYGRKPLRIALMGFLGLTLASYATYVHFRSNNVPEFFRWMGRQGTGREIVFAPRAYEEITEFDAFTDGYFRRGLTLTRYDSTRVRGECHYVSRGFMKFGHEGKQSPEEVFTRNFLRTGRLRLQEHVGGYNVYVLDGR